MSDEIDVVEKLKFWRLEEFVSLHQACMLAVGLDPYEEHDFHGWKDLKAPANYAKIYHELDDLIHKEYFYTVSKVTTESDSEQSDTEIYPPNHIFWPHNVIFEGTSELVGVRQATVKKWLASKGIDCPYYSALDIDEDEKDVILKPRGKHTTRLLGILDLVIERYYGDGYEPNDKDTITKQIVIVEWLQEKYSLSKREAEAIDIITRPEIARRPKGKD